MADISKIKLPDGTTYNLKDGRVPSATTSDEGKVVMVNDAGELALFDLPIYDGTVITNANGESF